MLPNNYDTPHFNNKVDRECQCGGEDKECPNCEGTGIEEVSQGEGDFDIEQQRYDDYYDRDMRE